MLLQAFLEEFKLDNGLYDALNKGFRMAAGDVVGILHADDFFASANVLQFVADVFQNPSVDACYGDLLYVTGNEGRGKQRRYNLQN